MARIYGGGGVSKAVAITDTYVVTNPTDLTGLTDARVGDVGIVTSTNKTYILQVDPYSTLGNWVELLSNSVIAGGAVAGNVAYFNNGYTIIGSSDFRYEATPQNLVFGPSNTAQPSAGYSFVGGWGNASLASRSIVFGEGLIVGTPSAYSAIFGYSGTLTGGGNLALIYGSAIVGSYNVVGGTTQTVTGDTNAVFGSTHGVTGNENVVGGYGNTVGSTGNIVVGWGSSTTVPYSALFGYQTGSANVGYNIVAGRGSYAGGGYNAMFGYNVQSAWSPGDGNLAGGKDNSIGGSYNVVGGELQTLNSLTYSIVTGQSNTVGGGATYDAVFGKSHVISSNYSIVAGIGHTLAFAADHNAVFGHYNIIGNGTNIVAGQQNNYAAGAAGAVFGYQNVVTGNYCLVVGALNSISTSPVPGVGGAGITTGEQNIVTADLSAVFGQANTVSGTHNTVGGQNNVVKGSHNIVAGTNITMVSAVSNWNAIFGYYHTITSGTNHMVAGEQHTVDALYAAVFGKWNTVKGSANMVSGLENTADTGSGYGLVTGYRAKSRMYGQVTQGYDVFAAVGDAQTSRLVLHKATTDATQTELSLDGSTTYLTTEDNKAYLFKVSVIARNTALATETAGYTMEFVFDRGAGVGTSRISGITKNVVHEDVAAWDVTATADLVNGRPAIKVTGEALKTIHWVAKVEMTEVQ